MGKHVLMLSFLAIGVAGCACRNPENTPLLTWLDDVVRPETTLEKSALCPVFVPVGTACVVLDVCVLHPIHAVMLGARDTWQIVWAGAKGSFVEQSLLFVPRIVASAPVFALCWFGETAFDIRGDKAESKP